MNQKMHEYLDTQFEALATAHNDILWLIEGGRRDTLLKLAFEVKTIARRIQHAIFESDTCEDCQQTGLVDAPGPTVEPKYYYVGVDEDSYYVAEGPGDVHIYRGAQSQCALVLDALANGTSIEDAIKLAQE